VARNSSEAKYRSLTTATCEAQWLSYSFIDMHIPLTQPITLFCDNWSAIHIANNLTFHERTRHIEMDYHIVREKVLAKLLHLLLISTHHQTTYILSNALQPGPFSISLSKLNLKNIYSSAWGRVLTKLVLQVYWYNWISFSIGITELVIMLT